MSAFILIPLVVASMFLIVFGVFYILRNMK